jgi:nicotinate-nucleotide pyrophosphorylase (carboxylating)
MVFRVLDPTVVFTPLRGDGDQLDDGDTICRVSGRMRTLLTGERTALNFLQRLSGVATHVRRHVEILSGRPVRLVDTRKTTPGWRVLEKYAVRVGGASNHRMNLSDGVLIKDNHIAACGGIAPAVQRAREACGHLQRIEVEAADMRQVREALQSGADIIMLDNMDLDGIREAVDLIAGRALVEVSGGVTRDRLPALAATGVDIISCGALTHSAVAVDISMSIKAAGRNH